MNEIELLETSDVAPIESQLGSFPAACGELYFAMNVSLRSKHQAPKREAFGCRDAPPRFIRGRRSRGLAPGWQTKGADIHFPVNKTVSSGLAKADLSNVRI